MQDIELKDIKENDFKKSMESAAKISEDVLSDIEISIEARVGEKRLTIGELNSLKKGEVLTLDTSVSEPVLLLYKNAPFASGELVTDGDKLGIRITHIENDA